MKADTVNEIRFYSVILFVWFLFMTIRYSDYSFYGKPIRSLQDESFTSVRLQRSKRINKSIDELKKSLSDSVGYFSGKEYILHNIGTGYYDIYKIDKNKNHIDSTIKYYNLSIKTKPHSKFYYNIGRIFTEFNNTENAKYSYEKALELNPGHILALHNLALLNYFELHNNSVAEKLLKKALSINDSLPICNYILGEIAMSNKKLSDAAKYYKKEVANYLQLRNGEKIVPVSNSASLFALTQSYYKLVTIYSSGLPNIADAEKYMHLYLSVETNPQRKNSQVKKILKIWKRNGWKMSY